MSTGCGPPACVCTVSWTTATGDAERCARALVQRQRLPRLPSRQHPGDRAQPDSAGRVAPERPGGPG
eukprot:11174770-Lingulodinium_polyedra.AAC.1